MNEKISLNFAIDNTLTTNIEQQRLTEWGCHVV